MLRGVEEIGRFAMEAAPGDVVTYGRGEHPPREMVRAMAPFVSAGVLHPKQKREAGGILFMIERGSGALASVHARARRGTVRRKRVAKSSITLVFECLVRAVRGGQPCPTNDELTAACGLTGRLAASYRMRKLVAMGWIAVEDRHPYGRRKVTILRGPLAGRATIEAPL